MWATKAVQQHSRIFEGQGSAHNHFPPSFFCPAAGTTSLNAHTLCLHTHTRIRNTKASIDSHTAPGWHMRRGKGQNLLAHKLKCSKHTWSPGLLQTAGRSVANPNCASQSFCLFFCMFPIFTFPFLHLTHSSCSSEQFLTVVLKLLQEKIWEEAKNIEAGLGQWAQKFFFWQKPAKREILFQALCKLREFWIFFSFFLDPGFWRDEGKISERNT